MSKVINNSQAWLQKVVHVALFLPVGPSSYMFIHKTPCDDVVAQFGGVWSARRAGGGLDSPLFREDILDDLACRQFRVRRGNLRGRGCVYNSKALLPESYFWHEWSRDLRQKSSLSFLPLKMPNPFFVKELHSIIANDCHSHSVSKVQVQ